MCQNCKKKFKCLDHPKQKYCSISCGLTGSRTIDDPNPVKNLSIRDLSYLMGLIWSDGCLSQDKKKSFRITIGLKDQELLTRLHPIFCPDRQIYHQTTWTDTNAYSIINKNKDFIDQMIEWGLTERKSLTLSLPSNINELSLKDFIRGYFDGDGSVFVFKHKPRKYLGVSFTCGNTDFLVSLNNLIKEATNVSFKIQTQKDKASQTRLNRTNDIKTFAKWIYSGEPTFYLDRKRQIFIENQHL